MRRASLLLLLAGCDAPGDAVAVARATLGSSVVAAERFSAGGSEWIAAARLDSAARTVVLLRRGADGWQAVAPRLDADAGWGVADVDGDGAREEVWAARVAGGPASHRVAVDAYLPAAGTLYRLQVPGGPDGLARAQREFSFNVMDRPAVQRWLTARADSVARSWLSAPAR